MSSTRPQTSELLTWRESIGVSSSSIVNCWRSCRYKRTPTRRRPKRCVLISVISSFAQVSHVRVSSLETRLETLVQSERLLKEQVCSLELEKNQLIDTVAHLQQILAKFNIQTSPDGHTLPSTSDRHQPTAGHECRDDSGLSSPLSDCLIPATT